jgi:hypothetical protein
LVDFALCGLLGKAFGCLQKLALYKFLLENIVFSKNLISIGIGFNPSL